MDWTADDILRGAPPKPELQHHEYPIEGTDLTMRIVPVADHFYYEVWDKSRGVLLMRSVYPEVVHQRIMSFKRGL